MHYLTGAVALNDMELTQLLLENGADTKAIDFEGCNPLHLAISCRNHQVAGYLLKFYADSTDNALDHALGIACSQPDKKLELIEKLLKLGASLNVEDRYGLTPLHAVAETGFTKAGDILLKYGGDIEKATSRGFRPLMMAAMTGHLETTKFLVEKGADVNGGPIHSNRISALGGACFNGHLEVVKWLLDNGATASSINFKNDLTSNILLRQSHIEIFRLLLHKRVDVNAEDTDGTTALFSAVQHNHVELVKILLELGADVMKIHPSSGASIFHVAALTGNKELLEMLTKIADPSFTKYLDASGRTAGVVAAISGKIATLEHLASIGPNETLQIKSTYDMIHILRWTNYAAILALLSKHGALDVTISSEYFATTILQRICGNSALSPYTLDSVLDRLVKYGFKFEITDFAGRTLLYAAIIGCKPEIVKLLLVRGCNFQLRDKYGFNTFDHLLYRASKSWAPPGPPPRPPPSAGIFPMPKPPEPLKGISPLQSPNRPQIPSPPVPSKFPGNPTFLSSAYRTYSPPRLECLPAPVPHFKSTSPPDVAAEALLYDKNGNTLTDDVGGTILRMYYLPIC